MSREEDKKTAGLVEEMEKRIVIHHAKMIEDYCKSKKACITCAFYCGICSLTYGLPSDWRIKEVEENGDE